MNLRGDPRLSRTLEISSQLCLSTTPPRDVTVTQWTSPHLSTKVTPSPFESNRADELESFRSRWRQEIQKAHSPVRNKVHDSAVAVLQEPSPRHSEDDALPSRADITRNNTPLEVYENAILKERQGSLSEAVIQYRRAFKVLHPLLIRGLM